MLKLEKVGPGGFVGPDHGPQTPQQFSDGLDWFYIKCTSTLLKIGELWGGEGRKNRTCSWLTTEAEGRTCCTQPPNAHLPEGPRSP